MTHTHDVSLYSLVYLKIREYILKFSELSPAGSRVHSDITLGCFFRVLTSVTSWSHKYRLVLPMREDVGLSRGLGL